jgi:Mrp family chromosome partitioning ATPase/uncharacterized protein involved in exopolysaccharide biosynthesis
MFESFVVTQSQLVRSRRILDSAFNRDDLRKSGWPLGSAGLALLDKRLEVKVPRGSELITVSVSHPNPAIAQAAVKAVLDAYKEIELGGSTGMAVELRETALLARQVDLRNELDAKRVASLGLALDYGTDDLDQLYQTRMNTLVQIESSLAQNDLAIAHAEGAALASADPKVQGENEEINALLLAKRDEGLSKLLAEEQQLQLERDNLATKLGPSHRTMLDFNQKLATIRARILERAKLVASLLAAHEGVQAADGASLKQLHSVREKLLTRWAEASKDMKDLGSTRVKILAAREEAADLKRDLDETTARLNEIKVEKDNLIQGRVAIVESGDLPVAPSTDRRLPLALFGALLGMALGGGLVWAYGFLRDGYRHADDLESAGLSAPLLGIIPDLTKPVPGEDEQAALSVHHIRNSLQLQTNAPDDGRGRLFTITSSGAGEGKTHLALALGMSFAMAGKRTLLIDADLVGRALTAQLGLRGSKGLSEAIGAATLNGEVHSARDNLWALPAGAATDFRPEQLSTTRLSQLLDQARGAFDAVIIDSGPIMGSLEANLATSLSDRVVLVVGRGQDPKNVRTALNRLRGIGAVCAGLVFNRALSADFARSVSAMSLSARTSRRSNDVAERSTALARALENPGGEAAHDVGH